MEVIVNEEIGQLELIERCQKNKQRLIELRNNIAESFFEMGYVLREADRDRLYLAEGCRDVYEYAQLVLNINYKKAWTLMKINEKYSVNGEGKELLPQYKGYSESLLGEMIQLPEEDYELVTADTRVIDVRELKRAEKEVEEEQKDNIPGQMDITQMDGVVPETQKKIETTLHDAIRAVFRPRERKEALIQIIRCTEVTEWWVNMFNPTGVYQFNKGRIFLSFRKHDEGVKIREVGVGVGIQNITYDEFKGEVMEAFSKELSSAESMDDVKKIDVWEEAFGEEERQAEAQERTAEENRKQEEQLRKEKEKLEKEKARLEQEKAELERKKAEQTEKDSLKNKEITKNTQSEVNPNLNEESQDIVKNEPENTQNDTTNQQNEQENNTFSEESKIVDTENDNLKNELDLKDTQSDINREQVEERTEVVEEKEVVSGEVEESVCDIAQSKELRLRESEYADVIMEYKQFIICNRRYAVGDILRLSYCNAATGQAAECNIKVIYVEESSYLQPGYTAYGFERILKEGEDDEE